ncbi:hypothetical protein MPSEU_000061000 [Mayamaea pseudoterrestris]|nr:hypothetical protein MPSEU_000061000 [Mayamaea pseudoterrestris]
MNGVKTEVATTPTNGTAKLNLGEIPILVMRRLHSDQGSVVHETLKELTLRCKSTDANAEKHRKDFVLSGGYSTVVLIMEKWPDSLGIQQESVRALCNASFTNPLIPSEVGLVEVVTAFLRRFPQDATRVETGIIALNNMSSTCLPNLERIVNDAGLRVVLEAMNRFQAHNKIQIWGSKLMFKASFHAHLAPKVVQDGGLQALAHVIQSHTLAVARKEAKQTVLALLAHMPLD